MSNIITFPPFEDFNQAYKEVNKAFLADPHAHIDYIRGAQGLSEDIIIKVKNPTCNISLEKVGYSSGHKWSTLVKTYIDYEELLYFKDQMNVIKGLSWTYRFKSKKKNNGGCLIAITLTRTDSNEPFQRAKVIWRTSELQRRWLADLILLDRFFDFIGFQPEETTLYLCQGYQSWLHVGPLMFIYEVEPEDLDLSHEFTRRVYESYHRVYADPNRPPAKYSPTLRMQKFYWNKKNGLLPDFKDPLTLSIKKVFKK